MPNITITITVGSRDFEVACHEGEEHFLKSAARLLDNEASVLVRQIGRMPESRMLLMAGLMLADKTAGMHEQLGHAQAELASLQAEMDALKSEGSVGEDGGPGGDAPPLEELAALAERAEALAEQIEAKAAG